MLKGCKKQMIVLHGTGSEIFDEAYFILKNKSGKNEYMPVGKESAASILEANRILEECRLPSGTHSRSYYCLKYLLFFLCGLALGMGSVILAFLMS